MHLSLASPPCTPAPCTVEEVMPSIPALLSADTTYGKRPALGECVSSGQGSVSSSTGALPHTGSHDGIHSEEVAPRERLQVAVQSFQIGQGRWMCSSVCCSKPAQASATLLLQC